MTIQILRPDTAGSTPVQTVTTGGGGVPHVALGDNSDASYVEYQPNSGSTSNTYNIPCSTYTLLAGEVVRRFRVVIRHRGAGGSTGYQVDATGFASGLGGTSSIVPAGRAAFGTDVGNWYTEALNQTQVDSLLISVSSQLSGGFNPQVADVWIELDVNHAPTTAVTLPTTTQTTPTPTIVWTYSDTDSDIQAKYHVKLFTAAEYGAVGFDPATSIPSFDYGEMTGANTSLVTGALSDNTYRAYVRTNDGTLWSAWAAGTSFAVSSTPPVAPAIPVATVDNTYGRIIVLNQAYVNMLSTDDANVETTIGNWIANANCSVARSTTLANNGSASARLSSTAAGDMSAILATAGRVSAIPGVVMTAIASIRAGATSRSSFISLVWYNAAGGVISTTDGTAAASATATWTSYTVSAAAPALAKMVGIKVTVVATGAAAELHYMDTIQITPTNTVVAWQRGGLYPNAQLVLMRSNDNGATYQDVGSYNLAAKFSNGFADDVLADGPLGYYKLKEQSGIIAYDSSGRNLHGTYVGGFTLGVESNLPADFAVTFDGTTGLTDCGPLGNAVGQGDVTYEAWIRTTYAAGNQTIVAETSTVTSVFAGIRTNAAGQLFAFFRNDAVVTLTITGTIVINDGLWHHVAATKVGSTITLYVDGVADGTGTLAGTFSPGAFTISSNAQRSGGFFNGTIGEAVVYSKGLTQARFQSHIAAPFRVQGFNAYDSAAANQRPAQYKARIDSVDPTGTPYSSAVSAISNIVIPSYTATTGWLLKDPVTNKTIDLPLVNPPFKHMKPEQQAKFNPLGRTRVIIVSDQIQGEEFDFEMLFMSRLAFSEFSDLRALQRTLLLQRTETSQQWYVRLGSDFKVQEPNTGVIEAQINAVEVDVP